MKLLAISDLHLGHPPNREALKELRPHPDDWLIVAGDVGEQPAHLEFGLDHLTPRFRRIIWTPGNHDLWISPAATAASTDGSLGSSVDRYDELVAICRAHGVLTPEDPYVEWPDQPGTFIVPMFLLFDYTFRPAEIPVERAANWARESGVWCSDEQFIDPAPWPSRAAWCHARCNLTRTRLDALPPGATTILVNHWPLRFDLARPPRIPRFSVWCGTSLTEDWGHRFRARAVISGHLHMRTTLWREGVRYDEVSLGYPRDWQQDRGIGWYLREILPSQSERFVPGRDPFL